MLTRFFTGDNACAPGDGAALSLMNWTGVKDVVRVPLLDSGVFFSINGKFDNPRANESFLEVNEEAFLAISCKTEGSLYVGGLLRVSQSSGSSTINVGDAVGSKLLTFLPYLSLNDDLLTDSAVAEACLDEQGNGTVAGVMQLDREEKCQLTGLFVPSSTEYPVVVDMTVVLSNDATSGRLRYTYGQFLINIVPRASPTPTLPFITGFPAPTEPPVLLPMSPGTDAPSQTIVDTSTKVPTPSPEVPEPEPLTGDVPKAPRGKDGKKESVKNGKRQKGKVKGKSKGGKDKGKGIGMDVDRGKKGMS